MNIHLGVCGLSHTKVLSALVVPDELPFEAVAPKAGLLLLPKPGADLDVNPLLEDKQALFGEVRGKLGGCA